jgi:hypothetical protein
LITLRGLISTSTLSYVYYRYTAKLQLQQRTFDELQAKYTERVESLRKSNATIEIQVPFTSTERECEFLGLVCHDTVRTTTVRRSVPAADFLAGNNVDHQENEALKAELNQLKQASALTVATGARTADLEQWVKIVKQLVSPVLSILVAIASLVVILSKKYGTQSEKWAFGSLGTILGFWLK